MYIICSGYSCMIIAANFRPRILYYVSKNSNYTPTFLDYIKQHYRIYIVKTLSPRSLIIIISSSCFFSFTVVCAFHRLPWWTKRVSLLKRKKNRNKLVNDLNMLTYINPLLSHFLFRFHIYFFSFSLFPSRV